MRWPWPFCDFYLRQLIVGNRAIEHLQGRWYIEELCQRRPSSNHGLSSGLDPSATKTAHSGGKPRLNLALTNNVGVWHYKIIEKQLITVHASVAHRVDRFAN